MNLTTLEKALRTIARPALLAAAAVMVMGSAALLAADQQNPGAQSQARKLEGTWRVQITLRDCQTGDPLRPPFPALATFASGGTMTTSDGGLSPLARGAGHGIWVHTVGHTFAALTEAFLFTPTGALSGTQRIRQAVEIGWDPHEFNATVSSEILDAQGTLRGTGCATSVGHRME
jgi:hypothetical protein